jgi:hypothetical protein
MPHCQLAPARAAGVARHELPVNFEADSDSELGRPLFGASTPEPGRLETIESAPVSDGTMHVGSNLTSTPA